MIDCRNRLRKIAPMVVHLSGSETILLMKLRVRLRVRYYSATSHYSNRDILLIHHLNGIQWTE